MISFKRIRGILDEASAKDLTEKKPKKGDKKYEKDLPGKDKEFMDLHKVETKTEDEYPDTQPKTKAPAKRDGPNNAPKQPMDKVVSKYLKLGGHGGSSKRPADKTIGEAYTDAKPVSDPGMKKMDKVDKRLRAEKVAVGKKYVKEIEDSLNTMGSTNKYINAYVLKDSVSLLESIRDNLVRECVWLEAVEHEGFSLSESVKYADKSVEELMKMMKKMEGKPEAETIRKELESRS